MRDQKQCIVFCRSQDQDMRAKPQTLKSEQMIILSSTHDLTGLRTALEVEEAGQWYLHDPAKASPITDSSLEALHVAILKTATPTAMANGSDYLRLLVDATAALHGKKNRSAGWLLLGVKPSTGRRYLGAESDQVPWPVYHAAVCFGLGYSRFSEDADHFEDDGHGHRDVSMPASRRSPRGRAN